MLTDTFTAQAFFKDFLAEPIRALRWTTLRQDSGDPFEFVREAKKAWTIVEEKAGVKSEDGVVAKGKRVIFSDSLDTEKAISLQKGCDELAIAGQSKRHYSGPQLTMSDPSIIWDRHVSHQRFPESIHAGRDV